MFQPLRVCAFWSFQDFFFAFLFPGTLCSPFRALQFYWSGPYGKRLRSGNHVTNINEWNLSETSSVSQGGAATVLRHHSVRVPVHCGDLGTFRDRRLCGDGGWTWCDRMGTRQETKMFKMHYVEICKKERAQLFFRPSAKQVLEIARESWKWEDQKLEFNWTVANVEIAAGQKNHLWTLKCFHF